MKQVFLALLAATGLVACSGETSFPDPSGKGTIRVINTIPTSPIINALIEERSLGQVNYKDTTSPVQFDDFEYNFNFEVTLAGQIVTTRVASERLKVDADQEYTFIISGDIANPTITIEQVPIRDFSEDSTIIELRIAHFAEGFPTVDVYAAPEGTPPALGEQLTTLAFGEIMAPADISAGDYVVTVTAAGDPSNVVFQSEPVTFVGGQALFVAALAPTAEDTDPLSIVGYSAAGGRAIITDASTSPTVRLFHGAQDLGNVDVYRDDDLNISLATDVPYRGISGDIAVPSGDNDLNLTPAGDTSTLLLERSFTASVGTRNNIVFYGTGGTYSATIYIPNRRPIETLAQIRLINSGSNTEFVDFYAVDTGTTIEDDTLPRAAGIFTGSPSSIASILDPGTYDFYATAFGDKTVLAGPVTVDVARGDVLEFILFDTVDPAVSELVLVPAP